MDAALRRAREQGLTFNLSKCKLGLKQIDLLYNVISKRISPIPPLARSVQDLLQPANTLDVQRRLVFINDLEKYVPKLCAGTTLIGDVIRIDVFLELNCAHQAEWEALKVRLCSNPLLGLFDTGKSVKV